MSTTQDKAADQDAKHLWSEFKAAERLGRAKLVTRREILPRSEFAKAMGVSFQELRQAVAERRLFSLDVDGVDYYPAFYLDPSLDRRMLEHVSQALGDLNGWSKWQFFVRPKGSLGDVAPVTALTEKKLLSAVLTAAAGFVER